MSTQDASTRGVRPPKAVAPCLLLPLHSTVKDLWNELVRSRARLLRTGASNLVRFLGRLRPGGDERNRTVDLRLAKPALSQLSYIPACCALRAGRGRPREFAVVGPSRIELPASRLSGARSNQLSYGPTQARLGGRLAVASFER